MLYHRHILLSIILIILIISCRNNQSETNNKSGESKMENIINLDSATFGAGCFWCVEAVFQRIKGVKFVESGYSGGNINNPSYKQVCTGNTGHAEVSRIYFDAREVSFSDLLEVFWGTHDPTTLNRQGADAGTQYRSVIFYHNSEQKRIAEEYKKKIEDSKIFDSPVVTEISPVINFFKAEDYHQNYYNENQNQPYCSFVITPKLEKLKKLFKDKLKN
jgi:peptide-methionine (S)-S-oxide reductase